MSLGIFLAVLAAALLHASWNAIIRVGSDKVQGMLLLSVSQGLMGVGDGGSPAFAQRRGLVVAGGPGGYFIRPIRRF